MAANVVGSVRRTDHPDGVTLDIDGSDSALWAAVRLMLAMLLCIAVAALAVYLSAEEFRPSRRDGDGIWPVVWGIGGVVLLWWNIGRNIAPLLRTALGRVTIRVKTGALEMITRRGDVVTRIPWAAGGIDES